MRSLFKLLLDLIYAPACVVCNSPTTNKNICDNCLGGVNFIAGYVDAQVQNHYSRLWALALYEGPWMDVIHCFKYGRGRAADPIILETLNKWIAKFDDIDCVVPVPLNWRRYLGRGYNQSAIVAQMVANIIGRPRCERAVVRAVYTPPQVGRTLGERKRNLKHAFHPPRFRADRIEDKNILLVDDVVTSGATVDECARALKEAGAARVDVLTLAKTP